MINPEGNEGTNVHELYERALQAGIEAYSIFFAEPHQPTINFTIQEATEEAHTGLFPARVYPDERVIFIHHDTVLELHKDLSQTHDIDPLDLVKLYISSAVINTLMAEQVSPRNSQKINELFGRMASPEATVRQVYDEAMLEMGQHYTDTVVATILSKSEDEICEMNRLRAAIGMLCHYESLAGSEKYPNRQQIDFGQRITSAFKKGMQEYISHQKSYESMARAFGLTEYAAASSFRQEILPLELAAAFPMTFHEVVSLTKFIQEK